MASWGQITHEDPAVIKVSLPEQSTVTVKPPSVKSGAVEDLEVEYEAEATRYGGNLIQIDLPTGWSPAYDGSFTIGNIDYDGASKSA